MPRLTIARSLLLALGGLTVLLAVLAGLGVAALYAARQEFEESLSATYAAEVATANLLAASVVEETVLRSPTASGRDRARARTTFATAADAAAEVTRGDEPSADLVAEIRRHEALARRHAAEARRRGRDGVAAARRRLREELVAGRRAATLLVERQEARRREARREVSTQSRRATAAAAAAGGLAVLGALALVALLVGGMRRPLADLLAATRRLAGGDLAARVDPSGPSELRELAASFNTMAAELHAAREGVEIGRRRLAATIESLSDALVICDADGHVIEVNPRAGELVPDLAPGHRADPGGDGPLPALADALGREAVVVHRERTLSVTAARMGPEGRDGVVWTIRDVTERAQLERAKSEFVATASHELRSPLTSIKGFVELLSAAELPERQQEFVDVILLSTNRLVDLVNDLLDVARVEAGQLEVQRRPIAISEAVEEVATMMRARIEAKRQTLAVEVAPGLPAAYGDPVRIRQIVTNLLTNAHLYTPEEGVITMRVGARDEWVTLTVSDTGRGMSPDERVRLFERFYRGDSSHTTPGTGLGMSIVRSLVDLHDGGIDVESAPGEGTTITVRIPRAPAGGGPGAPRTVRGRRVLVVEEDLEVAAVIARHLEGAGMEVETASSAGEALERLAAGAFDAVTLDVLLGGAEGFGVLRAIRDDPRLRRLPVVVVSSFPSDDALAGEWTVGKPVDTRELTDALGTAMLAGRARLLAVGRGELRPRLGPLLEREGVEYAWATTPVEAARLCEEHRFEVALVDAAMRSPEAAIAQLDLRGRRLGRSVFVLADDDDAPGLARLGAERLGIEDAVRAVVAALDGGQR